MEKMLGRLVSENIQLDNLSEPNICCIKADPGQIEQVILNLITNAANWKNSPLPPSPAVLQLLLLPRMIFLRLADFFS